MAANSDIQRGFEEILELSARPDARVYGSGLWKKLHKIADAGYPLAKDFFVEKLEHPRWDWRKVCVSLLGFHYALEPRILEKIRSLLLHDPESGVRAAAASVLGHQGTLPEKSLVHALAFDSSKFVKEAAFSALLTLAGVPYKIKLREIKKIRDGEIKPSLDQIKQVLVDEKLLSSLSLING